MGEAEGRSPSPCAERYPLEGVSERRCLRASGHKGWHRNGGVVWKNAPARGLS
jgi:hypothetical protein